MRAGFMEMRSSYSEKSKNHNMSHSRNMNSSSRIQPNCEYNTHDAKCYSSSDCLDKAGIKKYSDDWLRRVVPGSFEFPNMNSEARMLYRSNSSLDIERKVATPPMHRDYGSANSLDTTDRNNEGGGDWFNMLEGYTISSSDQRAQPTPELQTFMRGKQEKHHGFNVNTTVDNTFISSQDQTSQNFVADPRSVQTPKTKQKSQKHKKDKSKTKTLTGESSISSASGASILKKLRGKQDSNDTALTMDATDAVSLEQKARKKAIVHYDVQSVCVVLGKQCSDYRNNFGKTTTGASAASVKRRSNQSAAYHNEAVTGSDDIGDGKKNSMVASCPFFRNELGGEEERMINVNRATTMKRLQKLYNSHEEPETSMNIPSICNSVAILDTATDSKGDSVECGPIKKKGFIMEHVDYGAYYYRKFFNDSDHQNFVCLDEQLGPIAVSLKREKIDEKIDGKQDTYHQHRFIIRTSQLTTMRGSILEDAIPTSTRLASSARGPSPKDVLEYIAPELPIQSLKFAQSGPQTSQLLLTIDEETVQTIDKEYKFGVMYCGPGQSTEEQMYNNTESSPAFREFLDCLGHRVRLKGFDGYRGGLDCKTDSTGNYSVYTRFEDYEVMFHVSTLLPYTPQNKQQLLRKRHIGNNIVTIIFQEPGSLPFSAEAFTSQFQHVFIIVKVNNPYTENVSYSLAVSRSKDVPSFGPTFSEGSVFKRSREFAEFLIVKAINGINAALKSPKFEAMATRTRHAYLRELAEKYSTNNLLDSGSKVSKFSLGSGRKKERVRTKSIPDLNNTGGLVWRMKVDDYSSEALYDCLLVVGQQFIVIIECSSETVIFAVPCAAVIGWRKLMVDKKHGLCIYYHNGECVKLYSCEVDDDTDIQEIVQRLTIVSDGCEATKMQLVRNEFGHVGLHMARYGIVASVDTGSKAYLAGIRNGSRIVDIREEPTITLTMDQMIEYLRASPSVYVHVISPTPDGHTRRGILEDHSSANKCQAMPSGMSAGGGTDPQHQYLSATERDDLSYASLSSHGRPASSTHDRYMPHSTHSLSSSSSHPPPPPLPQPLPNLPSPPHAAASGAGKHAHYSHANTHPMYVHPQQTHNTIATTPHTTQHSSYGAMKASLSADNALYHHHHHNHQYHHHMQSSHDSGSGSRSSGHNSDGERPWRVYPAYSANQESTESHQPVLSMSSGAKANTVGSGVGSHVSKHNRSHTTPCTISIDGHKPTSVASYAEQLRQAQVIVNTHHQEGVPPQPPPRQRTSLHLQHTPPQRDGANYNYQSDYSTGTPQMTVQLDHLPNPHTSPQDAANARTVIPRSTTAPVLSLASTNKQMKQVELKQHDVITSNVAAYTDHHGGGGGALTLSSQKTSSISPASTSSVLPSSTSNGTGGKSTATQDPADAERRRLRSNRFQQELIKLIDPEVSLTELKHSLDLNGTEEGRTISIKSSSPSLHRTLSDDSIVGSLGTGTQYKRYSPNTRPLPTAVHQAKTAASANRANHVGQGRVRKHMLSDLQLLKDRHGGAWNSEYQLSGRSMVDNSDSVGGGGTSRSSSGAVSTSAIPATITSIASTRITDRTSYNTNHRLVDSHLSGEASEPSHAVTTSQTVGDRTQDGEESMTATWKHLVNEATYAIQDVDISCEVNGSGVGDTAAPSSLSNIQSSQSNNMTADTQHESDTTTTQQQQPAVPEANNAPTRPPPPDGWRNSSALERIQDLESQINELTMQLQQERLRCESLESENQRLREDNLRLEKESITAATQLRRFTEWFFNTIDKQ